MRRTTRSRLLCAIAVTAGLTVLGAPAHASPGDNGPFAVTIHTKTEDGRYLQPQVWTMADDGTDLHQQFAALEEANEDAVWSPDGEWLAFRRGGALVVSRPDGSASRIIAQDVFSHVSWSPDGTRLVFTRGGDGGDWAIWMVGADGTDEHVVHAGKYAESPAWSPQGDRIAFAEQDPTTLNGDPEIWTMDTDGTDVRQVTFNGDGPDDGHRHPDIDMEPAWSPDGSQLVVASTRDAAVDCGNCIVDLYVSDADGSRVQLITHEGNEYFPTFSPDGRFLAFVTEPTPPYRRDDPVWYDRLDLATGEVVHLARGDLNSSLDWSVRPGSVPLADLGSTVTVADPVAAVGSTTQVAVSVQNDGERAARSAEVQVRLPAGTRYDGGTAGCTGTTAVACTLGALSPGESATRTLALVLDTGGVGEVSALATSLTPDPDLLDNRATAQVASCTQVGTDGEDVITGTDGGDVLCGGPGDDRLVGGAGDDVLVGGPGDDSLDGSTGRDSASYAVARSAVRVDLLAGSARGDGTDALAGVEGVTGSPRADVLLGTAAADRLSGLGGADRLDGRGADDVLDGGLGGDVLVAGAGDDVARGGPGADAVAFAPDGPAVTVDLSRRSSTGQGSDRLAFVEDVRATRRADDLTGSVATNVIDGGAGDDELHGLGGNDRVAGGPGRDDLHGGDGRDRLAGGSGRDRCDQQTGRGTSVSCEG